MRIDPATPAPLSANVTFVIASDPPAVAIAPPIGLLDALFEKTTSARLSEPPLLKIAPPPFRLTVAMALPVRFSSLSSTPPVRVRLLIETVCPDTIFMIRLSWWVLASTFPLPSMIVAAEPAPTKVSDLSTSRVPSVTV